MAIDIPRLLDGLDCRYPALLVDAVVEHDPGRRMVAVKNVTVNEEYFHGHFPGMPLMPGVMMIESLLQVATLLLRADPRTSASSAFLRGVNHAKFRRQVVPGDRIDLDVELHRQRTGAGHRARRGARGRSGRRRGRAAGRGRAPARPLLTPRPSCIPAPSSARAVSSSRTPSSVRTCASAATAASAASAVIDGDTVIGDACHIYPFASIGLIPQDLKFRGEPTRLVIGERNVFREFVTVHRGTRGGGGVTNIGNDNVFMAYAHVAHDCHNRPPHDLRQRGDPRRPRRGRGRSDDQRLFGRSPVLPRRPAGVYRRLFRGHEGCPAVRQDGGQPGAHLRPQHDRSRAPRKLAGHHCPAQAGVPLPAAVEAEHHARRAAHPRGSGRGLSGGRLSRGVHPGRPGAG